MKNIELLRAAQVALNEAFFAMDIDELKTHEAHVVMADLRQTLRAMDPNTFVAPDPDNIPFPFDEAA